MAQKKGLAAFYGKRKKPTPPKKNAPFVSNPPLMTDLVDFIVPGFVGYAATRFLGRLTHSIVSRRWPKLGRHAAVLSGGAAFGASWFLAHKIPKVQKYHTPIVVGSAIAAAQTAVQCYLPKYGWIVSDFYDAPIKSLQPPPADVQRLVARRAAAQKALAEKNGGSSEALMEGNLGSLSGGAGAFSNSDIDELEAELGMSGDDDDNIGDELDDDYYDDLA